jgi:hypothetical protein
MSASIGNRSDDDQHAGSELFLAAHLLHGAA